jgi:hypothetical protein
VNILPPGYFTAEDGGGSINSQKISVFTSKYYIVFRNPVDSFLLQFIIVRTTVTTVTCVIVIVIW